MSVLRESDSPLFVLGFVATCVMGGFLLVLLAGPRVSIKMPGRVASAPADWWLLVYLRPQVGDRWMDVSTEGSTGFYRAIGFELEGVRSPRARQVWFRALPAGCYDFQVAVRETDQRGRILAQAYSPQRLSVVGIGVEGNPCD